jgi:RHS repeat-associated protein
MQRGQKIAHPTQFFRSLLVTTFGYYWGTGQIAKVIDPNSEPTYFHFHDSMNQPTSAQFPNGGWILTPPSVVSSVETGLDVYTGITSTQSTGCSSCRHDLTDTDGLGRPSTNKFVNDPADTTNGTRVVTTYDSNGRVYTVTNPYRTTSDSTYGVATFSYDGMNRTIQVAKADGSSVYTYYGASITSLGQTTQQCSTSTYGRGYPVLVVDEVGNKRQTWTDGFGRVIEADEPNASGALSPKSCSTYDLNNNLTGVLAADGSQTRSYSYDKLSRLTSKTEPEPKSTTTYFYYTTSGGSLCSGDPNAICRRTDGKTITTTYSYDSTNRLTQMSYSDSTPTVTYSYDSTSCLSLSVSCYNLGHRTGMSDGSGSTAWAYDAVGKVLRESRTINSVTKSITYEYNLDGTTKTITYPGGRKITYTTGNAELSTAAVDSDNSINYATSATYAPQGALDSVQNGANLGSKYFYNNRLQPCRISIRNTGSAPTSCTDSTTGNVLDLAYSYAQGTYYYNNGNITTQTNKITSGRTQTYTYDPLNRLLSAQSSATSGGDCWGQEFGNNATPPTLADDALGNLWLTTSTNCSSPAPSWSINGYNQITNSGFTYDNGGGNTADSNNTYSYDAENRLISAVTGGGTYCYIYDGNGLRVAKAQPQSGYTCTDTSPHAPTVNKIYWRDAGGGTIAESDENGSTTNSSYNEYVFFAGQRIAQSNPNSSTVNYYFADHLGSTRVVTDASGSPCFEADYLPYGMENTPNSFTNSCSTNYKFTGYERDTETGNDYAFARYYSYSLERFLSPDPLGGDGSDPQSLNRYTYVLNNPVNQTDPMGLCPEGATQCGPPCDYLCGHGDPCDWVDCGYPNPPDRQPPVDPPVHDPLTMGCESLGMPCGMQFPVPGGGGPSGCPYGSGSCGGIIFGAQDGQTPSTGSNGHWWDNIKDYVWIVIGMGKSGPQNPVSGTGRRIEVKGPKPPRENPWPEGEPPDIETYWMKWGKYMKDLMGPSPKIPFPVIVNPCAIPSGPILLPKMCGPTAMNVVPEISNSIVQEAALFTAEQTQPMTRTSTTRNSAPPGRM